MNVDVMTISPAEGASEAVDESASQGVMDYGTRMVQALRQMSHYLDMNNRYLLKHMNTTMPQLMCLEELSRKGAMTVGVLAKAVHLSASTLVGILDRLEDKTLIRRDRYREDRRSVFVDITPKGRKLITASPHLLQNRLSHALATLSVEEQVMMVNALGMTLDLLRQKDSRLDSAESEK